MSTLAELQAELAVVTTSIAKIYANIGLKKIEIQTPQGRTIIEQADFTKVLRQLEIRKGELSSQINNLMGVKSSIVDQSLPPLALPIVYNSGR